MRCARLLLFLAPLLPVAPGSAAPPPPAAELFFQPASFASPLLSPNGRRLAALTLHDGRHYALTLFDLATRQAEVLVKQEEVSVTELEWKTDDLLLIVTENDRGGQLLQSVDLATRKSNDLSRLNTERSGAVTTAVPEDPLHVICPWMDGGLRRVNVRTGKPTEITRGVRGVDHWVIDAAGNVWAGMGYHDEKWTFVWRATPDQPWKHWDQLGRHNARIYPLAVTRDRKALVVMHRDRGDTAMLAAFDLAGETLTEIFRPAEVDVSACLLWGFRREPCAAVYETTRTQLHFFHPEAQHCYRSVAAALPDADIRLTSFSRDNQRIIVQAESDRDPGSFFLLDRSTGQLGIVGTARSALPAASLAPSRFFDLKSRDGLKLRGRITLPGGTRPPPLVVRLGPGLPGPRAHPGFDATAQYLASRGFASVRVHVRGTSGYGADWERAGDLQLATGMVHDLEDAVSWLGQQGWIDVTRVAVWAEGAASIIAAHAGLSPTFRALVNISGLMFTRSYDLSQLSPSDREDAELVRLLGGSAAALRYLKSLDPLGAAARWRLPSFHAYPRTFSGDQIVESGQAVARILRKAGLPHVIYDPPNPDEKSVPAVLVARRMEAAMEFLRRNL